MQFRFENKDYGAWLLKRFYKKHVLVALVASTLVVFLIFIIPFLLQLKKSYTEPIRITPVNVVAELMEVLPPSILPEVPPAIEKEKPAEIPKILSDTAMLDKPVDKDSFKKQDLNPDTFTQNRLKTKKQFFCGGDMAEFRQWFIRNFKMPSKVYLANSENKIIVKFEVNINGKIDSISVLNSTDPIFSAQVRAILMESPVWEPCMYQGKLIRQQYVLPINLVKQSNDN